MVHAGEKRGRLDEIEREEEIEGGRVRSLSAEVGGCRVEKPF